MVNDFDFGEGDTVLVRVYESGQMKAKFVGNCIDINSRGNIIGSPRARIAFPAGTMNSITLAPYEAEFERVDSGSEVNF
jgi:hypothetical protein